MKYTTHTKGHYGIEDPELKFSKKGVQEDSYEKGQKSKSTKSVEMASGRGTNDYFGYHVLQSCGVQAVSYLKTKVIMKLIF